MKQIVIRFKKNYGSEIFYKCMLSIKKQYPNKKFSELLIHLPLYEINIMFLRNEFIAFQKKKYWEKTLKDLKEFKSVNKNKFKTS
jgi:hypothetical protein